MRENSALGEGGEFHDLAAGEGGCVGAKADAGPVGGLHRVRVAFAVLDERGVITTHGPFEGLDRFEARKRIEAGQLQGPRLYIAAMIPLAGLAVACGSSDSDSAAGNSSADFTLKVFDPGNSGAIAVGKRDGTYDEALAPLGAKIEWVKTTPGFSSNLKLFNSGELDIQTGAYSPVVGALSKDVGVRIFATSDPYNKDQAGIIGHHAGHLPLWSFLSHTPLTRPGARVRQLLGQVDRRRRR